MTPLPWCAVPCTPAADAHPAPARGRPAPAHAPPAALTVGAHPARVITRFSGGEHQLLLPLWPGDGEVDQSKTLANLRRWHQERFGGEGARLSGKHLESPEDRTAWDDLSP